MRISSWSRRTFALLTAIASLAGISALTRAATASDELMLAPENPAFVDYLQFPDLYSQQVMGMSDRSYYMPGLVPEPIDLSHNDGLAVVYDDAPTILSLPTSYDLRTTAKLTPIRNQGSCGSCWSFAAMGSVESSLMPYESADLSENNLKNRHGFDISCCSGGNRTMATAYLARWEGGVDESQDPYNAGSCYSPLLPASKHVQEVLYIPNRTSALDNNNLKEAVMNYGAVYTSYYHSDAYYNSSTRSYYYNGSGSSNHAVCIIGWNDNYPASNFATSPPGSGAFLIRNSWGTWWGDSGYFWISYYDGALGRSENAVFRAEPGTNYTGVYQYDTLGWVSNTGYGSTTAWFANVFTAASNSGIAAAAWYAVSVGTTYTLRVYVNPTSGPIGSTPAVTVSGSFAMPGYHTVKLPTAVPIAAGQKFSVVVQTNTPSHTYPIPVERPFSGYASGATAGLGQSYISRDGNSWTDAASQFANTNVCLKAFTSGGGGPVDPPEPVPGVLSVSPSGGLASSGQAGGPFSPASATYTLTNTGQTAINWTATKNAAWVSLSSASGSLGAGASATVTVSINSSANSLAAGSHADTVNFTNTTNGTGSTTRPVALSVTAQTQPGTISVSPSDGFISSGPYRGPFSPTSKIYTVTNTGDTRVYWYARKTQSWLTITGTGGYLNPGASATCTVKLSSTANYLSAKEYTDTLTFTNATNGNGSTTRPAKLTVGSAAPPAAGALSVGPTTGLAASGPAGGPFTPASASYTLTNTGGTAITWSASGSQSWTGLSSTGGNLNPGASTTVTVSISSAAAGLVDGSYSGTVSFNNLTNGTGNTSRNVSLTVSNSTPPPPSGAYRVVPETYSWIEPTGHKRIYLGDNTSTSEYLPFAFNFYGADFTRLFIASNGILGTSTIGITTAANRNLPYSGYPNGIICPYWDDLNPQSGSMYVGTVGSAPSRKYVVTWVDVPHRSQVSAKFTFQAILCEGTNDIVFQYAQAAPASTYGGGWSATVGIENASGTEACVSSYNLAGSVANGSAIRFTTH